MVLVHILIRCEFVTGQGWTYTNVEAFGDETMALDKKAELEKDRAPSWMTRVYQIQTMRVQ